VPSRSIQGHPVPVARCQLQIASAQTNAKKTPTSKVGKKPDRMTTQEVEKRDGKEATLEIGKPVMEKSGSYGKVQYEESLEDWTQDYGYGTDNDGGFFEAPPIETEQSSNEVSTIEVVVEKESIEDRHEFRNEEFS
jgi:hypothetical protein